MIKETCLSEGKGIIPKGDVVFDISGLGKGRQRATPLAPSRKLLEDWNEDRIKWKEYVERYFQQLYHDQEALSLLEELISLSVDGDVWLVGLDKDYPCHRFLLKQVVEKVLFERRVITSVEDYSEHYRTFKNMTKSQVMGMKMPGNSSPVPPSGQLG